MSFPEAIAAMELAVDSHRRMNVFGELLARARTARGLTQEDVARGCSTVDGRITAQQLSKWERGVVIPDARRAVAVAAYLGVTQEEALHAWGLAHLHRGSTG